MTDARTDLRTPELPESVADATVVALHGEPGQAVRRGELLVELETDKVVLEVPAPSDATLEGFTVAVGDVVTGGTVLGHLLPAGAAVEAGATAAAGQPAGAAASDGPGPAAEAGAADGGRTPPPGPAVRRLLAEHGLEAGGIPGSGRDGRLLKQDVERHLATAPEAPAGAAPPARPLAPQATQGAVATPQVATLPPPASMPPVSGTTAAPRGEQRVPMSRLRARVAERLLEATQGTAMLTTFNEVDLSEVSALRNRHRDAFEKRHGVRLGFMGFFVAACARALGRFPILNAALDGNEIVYHHHADIGIAVSSPRGLVVPVLRDAGGLSVAAIERGIREFADRAREGRLELDDLRGGTFTITNGGVFGSLLSTPILNPPQSAILGMHAVQDRPVARDGAVVIRPMMYLALSYDHRLVDGADAVRFLVMVKESIEDPARLLLDL
jgi:2-oxoglutarate dehydrogenase E2 component (dihydrolipoamide succinyltransferase)